MKNSTGERGTSLAELVITVAMAGVLCGTFIPQLTMLTRRAALRSAAARILYVMAQAQRRADAVNQYCGVKFTLVDTKWCYAIYDDGDGDGVRNDDIAKGVDTVVEGPLPIFPPDAHIRVGYPPAGLSDLDSGKLIPPQVSPVNFNASTICSFSPAGTGTPGSVYLTDGSDAAAMVRSSGSSSRVRMLFYNIPFRGWQE